MSNAIAYSVSRPGSPNDSICHWAVPLAFLFGILRMRLARSSVADVVVALQEGTPLRDALAQALADPSVEILYRLDASRGLGGAGWVDAEGRGVPAPAAGRNRPRPAPPLPAIP